MKQKVCLDFDSKIIKACMLGWWKRIPLPNCFLSTLLILFPSDIQSNHIWNTPQFLVLLKFSCFWKSHHVFTFQDISAGTKEEKWKHRVTLKLSWYVPHSADYWKPTFLFPILTISHFPLKCRRLMNYKSYAVGVSYLSFYLFQDEVVTCINKPPELFLVSSAGLSASWGFFQTSPCCLPWSPWQSKWVRVLPEKYGNSDPT